MAYRECPCELFESMPESAPPFLVESLEYRESIRTFRSSVILEQWPNGLFVVVRGSAIFLP
ncbi:hypothetical protein SAMN04488029_3201 [Reichenbachiella faecimaris]|uniref:Uncharacterized protein n=1 Tax=Reichenbachiella faecimaris TaxID=692418 RepID=A0A1W2GK47_REIFA|nr:hypothetical protein SAMN04488029_3201 [Reichenbachiella faecimaris]